MSAVLDPILVPWFQARKHNGGLGICASTVASEVLMLVSGLFLAAGFSGHGFMHAPATAELVVEEMLDGRARTLDISDLSLERFASGRRPFTAAVL